MEVPLVGDDDCDEATVVFELRIEDWVDTVSPKDFKLPATTPSLDPKTFFVTSGDAVQKARYLVRKLGHLLEELKKVKGPLAPYKKAITKTLKQANILVTKLEEVKGENVFLETEFNANRQLLVIPKNPRSKGA